MKNKKTIMIGILCTLVCVMAVGYALLAQQLNINGRASIDSTWKVEITNITEKDIVGDASSKETPSYTSTTANFSVGLIQPGDSISYDIEISNLGTLKAKVDSINVVIDENDAITYTTSGLQQGDKLGVGEKTILTVKVEYNSNVTTQPTNTGKDLTVTINYVQDLGNDIVTYDTYSIGDVVNFAGSNWYVIKNSSSDEDYVTLMKEKVLTVEELGEYAIGKLTASSTAAYSSMSYYWSDTCHDYYAYGYSSSDYSGCSGHNDYEGSKVKEFLEGTYINTLGSDYLKEVDGYKIRLITTEELNTNLGWSHLYSTIVSNEQNDAVPLWVYKNFETEEIIAYWTMSAFEYETAQSQVNVVYKESNERTFLDRRRVSDINVGVRPVINLLKPSI